MVTAAERPEVDVMDFLHALDGKDGASNVFDAQFTGAAFEKNVRGFAEDADAGPEDEQADGQAESRIDPMGSGGADDDGADDDGDVRKSVAEIVNEDAAQIEIAAAADESESDAAVDGKSRDGGPDHPAFDDIDRRAEALDSFVAEPERKENENDGVGEGGESTGAVIAISFFVVGGTFGPAHGEIGDAKRGNIGKIVDRVVQKSDAAAEDAAENFGEDEGESGGHGPAENGRAEGGVSVTLVTMIVGMGMVMVMQMTVGGVIVAMGMRAHAEHSTRSNEAVQASPALIGQFDTAPFRID